MRSFVPLACLMLLVMGACGKVDSPPPPDAMPVENHDGMKSGSRLKIRWADFDGSKVYAGLSDSMRGGEQCTPRKFSDAKTYCTPTGGTVVYRDAACTMPIGRQIRSCPQTQMQYFVETDPQACDNPAKRIFPRGAPLGGTVTYYTANATGCTGPFDGSSYDMFALGAEIPLTELAVMETPAATDPGRLQQRFAESADGARVFAGLYDSQLGSDCFLTLDATRAGARCVPNSASTGYYGDTTCTSQRSSFRKGCPAPKYATRYDLFCPYVSSVPTVYRNGALTTGALYQPNVAPPPACAAVTANPEQSYYEVGEQVSVEVAARAPASEGKGRYRFIYTTSGGSKLRDATLYDTVKQTECTPTTMPDGSMRCLPYAAYSTSLYYSDAACTVEQPVIIVPNAPATGCTLPPLPAYSLRTVTTTTPTCNVTREVRQVGAAYSGSLYFKTGTTCSLVGLGANTAYTLGAVGALDDWPMVMPTADP